MHGGADRLAVRDTAAGVGPLRPREDQPGRRPVTDNHPAQNNARTAPRSDQRRFFVLVGIPGSGKSTYAKLFLPSALRVSLDDIRLMLSWQTFVAKLEPVVVDVGTVAIEAVASYAAARGYDAVFDATSVTPKRRKPLIDLARRFGLSPVAIYIQVPLEVALGRNQGRPEPVPPEVVANFFRRLVVPTLAEGFDEVIVVNASVPGAEHDRVVSIEQASP